MPYLKPVLAGLLASVITYLCFLTWLHWKAVSLVKEQGATGLIGVTGGQVYVLHSPSFIEPPYQRSRTRALVKGYSRDTPDSRRRVTLRLHPFSVEQRVGGARRSRQPYPLAEMYAF